MGHGKVSQQSEGCSLKRTAGHAQEPAKIASDWFGPLSRCIHKGGYRRENCLSNPLLARGLVHTTPWSHTNEHTRNPVDRLVRLAEAGALPTLSKLFLRDVLPRMSLSIAMVQRSSVYVP